jgi:hypothetical protein
MLSVPSGENNAGRGRPRTVRHPTGFPRNHPPQQGTQVQVTFYINSGVHAKPCSSNYARPDLAPSSPISLECGLLFIIIIIIIIISYATPRKGRKRNFILHLLCLNVADAHHLTYWSNAGHFHNQDAPHSRPQRSKKAFWKLRNITCDDVLARICARSRFEGGIILEKCSERT